MEPTILNQRYHLVELVGAGGMATVYRAYDQLLERYVAVKFLREPYASNPAFRQRFLEEARAAARLDHPHIVRLYDVGEDEQHRPYIIMEMVEGEDLKAVIRRSGPLSVPRALELARQICAGVGHAHRASLIHCDLKPQNILVTPEGEIKVADFGIARAFQGDIDTSKPEEKVIWGSPHYISPEQATGRTPTPASDVYSIGVIMYEMLSGVPPFHDPDPTTLVMKHLREEPAPLTSLNPRIPPMLEWLVRKVLSKEPANRYRNADQLGIAIDEYQRQGAVTTAPHHSATSATPPPPTTVSSLTTPVPDVQEHEVSLHQRQEGPDWILWALLVVAAVTVIGLIPLWGYVYQIYTTTDPIPTVLPVVNTLTPEPDIEMVSVPNLVSLSATDAQRLAESLGLQIQVLGEQEASNARPGAILEQTPNSGTQVPVDSTISVVIAAGRVFVLPDVVGYQLDVIQGGLESEGLLLKIDEIRDTTPKGQVLKSDPSAGTQVRAGNTVTLTVSGGMDLPLGLNVNLNNQIILEQAQVSQLELHSGEMLPVTLRWRCIKALDRSYKVFIHVQTMDFQLITQQDIEPVNGIRPTNTWTPGEIINDPHQLPIPDNTPAGTYQVRVGLYDPEDRLPVVEPGQAQVVDDTIFITQIEVVP
ncbi:MAG: protein kinase [Anaerolineae bacterium]|nr:protein kinase [Anaerolineae bacterium]